MTRYAALATLVLAVSTPAPGSQARPDFSGQWTIDTPPAAAGREGQAAGARGGRRGGGGGRGAQNGDMGSGWGSSVSIAQDAAQLSVEYTFFARGDMQPPLRFVYALDGTETTNTVTMGRGPGTVRSRAAWDGSVLVITTVHTMTDPGSGRDVPVTVTRRLSLESPTSLAVDVTRAGVLGGPATSTRTVYRKAS